MSITPPFLKLYKFNIRTYKEEKGYEQQIELFINQTFKKSMNKSKTMKRAYMKPEVEIISTETDTQLLNGSFQGGHNGTTTGGDLGDSGDNGHTGGESGGGMGDAKNGFFDTSEWDDRE